MRTKSSAEVPAELRAKVLSLASQQASPSRAEVRRHALTWLVVGLGLPLVFFAFLGGAEQGPRPWSLLLLTVMSTGCLALLSLWGALGRGGRTLGRPRSRLLVVTLLLPVLLLVCKVGCSAAYPHMLQAWETRPGARCFGVSLLFGIVPLVAFMAARRGTDPVHPRTLGAALGAAGGLWAATLVDLWCPVAFPLHVVIGHVLPALLLAALGSVVGARLLAPRAAGPSH